jgi:hypothetical protein
MDTGLGGAIELHNCSDTVSYTVPDTVSYTISDTKPHSSLRWRDLPLRYRSRCCLKMCCEPVRVLPKRKIHTARHVPKLDSWSQMAF